MLYAIYICVYMHTYASIYMISLYIIDKYIISLGMSILRGQWNYGDRVISKTMEKNSPLGEVFLRTAQYLLCRLSSSLRHRMRGLQKSGK